MSHTESKSPVQLIRDLNGFAQCIDYSLLDSLSPDPQSTTTGDDYHPRQVFSGHYVPVKPTPIPTAKYITHSHTLFNELGLSDELAQTENFKQLFTGDMSQLPEGMKSHGWATGYALSIYGTEYRQQCPFQTGNGYGDGRALSIVEGVFNHQRWEMQLKGAGRTPYCRGADGRAVLRSSVREFLAQEHMHALGVPTSRSLSLFMSESETVDRPWYLEDSHSYDPEIMVSNLVAISTRVAPSFLRVGQIELFGRRARSNQHPEAMAELHAIVSHLIAREYREQIDTSQPFVEQVIALALAFRERLTSLVANWVRVGYCQGNFNSDNCAGGGFTLDYGPFGFCELFDPIYQPWTGGGRHFSFLNQPIAAEKNFNVFCRALTPLLNEHEAQQQALAIIDEEFADVMEQKMAHMWAAKLGLTQYNGDIVIQLLQLMVRTHVDYTVFFRELSHLPSQVIDLQACFYRPLTDELHAQWQDWLTNWRNHVFDGEQATAAAQAMKQVNPKYTWREWFIVPAYQRAEKGDFALIKELQTILNAPYDEQSNEVEAKYYQQCPQEYFNAGGISHYSCSS